MSIENGYVAAMFHDVKKTLLCRDEKSKDYGTWRPDHLRLDDLCSQGDTGDLPANKVDLENGEQILLIKLHQCLFNQNALKFNPETSFDIANLDTITAVSLMASDAMHKALYFGESEFTIGLEVAMRFPFYYPFYGQPMVWIPVEFASFPQNNFTEFRVGHIQNDMRMGNARKKFARFLDEIYNERKQAANKQQFLTANMMVFVQKELFADFPDTTFLPITSLAFHHQIVTALFFFIRKQLENFVFCSQCGEVEVPFYLNTIISPPEKLTNRLKDTATVRKISHRLQQLLHDYLNNAYLRPVQRFDFWYPDDNPFFFYNKDAIILLSSESDQKQIENICRDVAKETESVITLEAIKIDGKVQITLKDDSDKGKRLENLKLTQIKANGRLSIMSKVEQKPQITKSFWHAASPSPVTEEQDSTESHCHQCNKTVDDVERELKQDISTGDLLCKCCHALRRGYRFCPYCDLYFRQQKQGDKEQCPYCYKLVDYHKTTDLLQGRGGEASRQVHRVAYILIKTNCTHDAIKLEGDQLMAQFRFNRDRFEAGTKDNPKEELRLNLAQTSTTPFGVFEYLQAALNMELFQHHLKELLERTLKWLQQQQKRQREKVGYPIRQSDLTDEALSQSFLYRSPTLTLLVIPEEALRRFYDELRSSLNNLHIAHRLRMVACPNNHPVWMVLRSLGLAEERSFPFDELKKRSEELNEKLIPELRKLVEKKVPKGQWEPVSKTVMEKSKELLAEYRKQAYRLPKNLKLNSMELKLTIMRSGVERTFEGEQAHFLLTWEPKADVPTQIGHFAEFASRILSDPNVPEDAFHHNLFLELDSRMREKRKELIPQDVVKALRKHLLDPNLTPKATPGFIREIAAYQRLSPYEQHRKQNKKGRGRYVQSR
jgi:hypothetical protein